ncbi:tripartite tricarboxylate transporter TctB family protein [Bacillus horti]|uniref:Tricarboxylic transport membrane protein n=1 Tax=Caldalkalibacillus horti TaxID=77523 RepID=A0ABT9VWK1_9BACI|nr:tripartite tricarboxylate transporter TctB family protein [Bacillus horti]MDQ0164985.1 putative tricarboxylic transport membrane protein [Bacillus horti]
MKKANVVISLIVMMFAVIVFLYAGNIQVTRVADIGPDFFPKILSALLFFLGFLLFLQSRRMDDSQPEGQVKNAFITMGLMLLYLMLFSWVGFLLSTPAMAIVFLYYVKVRRWLPLLLTPIGVTVAIYLIFEVMLNVPLPAGRLFS